MILLLIISTLFSCAHRETLPDRPQTVSSDLYPVEMTRDRYYFEMGVAYATDGQSERAIDYFRLSILHEPYNIQSRLALVDEYRKTELYHLALYELGEIFKVEPKNKLALMKLGDLYLSQQLYSKARSAYADLLIVDDKYEEARWSIFYVYKLEENYQGAEKALNEIVMTDDNRARYLFEKSLVAKHFKRFDEYSLLLKEAHALQPHDRLMTLELSQHYFKAQEFTKAVEILQNYSETHDFDQMISENLTYAAVRSENYDLALKELERQQPWAKSPSQIKMKMAHVHFLAGSYQDAEDLYIDALARNPGLDEARFYLSQLYLLLNKKDLSRVVLAQLSSGSEYYPEAQMRLAIYEKENGDEDDGFNRARDTHRKRPDSLVVYKTYADFLIDAQKYVETVALLEKGIGYFPNDEELRVKVAFVHYRLKNRIAFKKHIKKALQLNPSSAEVYSYLAELWYLKRKDPKEVEFFANKALEFKTNNTNIKPLLAWSLLAQDRATEAVALFERFYEENPKQPYYAEALSKVYSRADVNLKAKDMRDLAFKLQINNRLTSSLILDSENKSIQSNQLNSSPVRLPASLENQ